LAVNAVALLPVKLERVRYGPTAPLLTVAALKTTPFTIVAPPQDQANNWLPPLAVISVSAVQLAGVLKLRAAADAWYAVLKVRRPARQVALRRAKREEFMELD
jgi:hypothetical protein